MNEQLVKVVSEACFCLFLMFVVGSCTYGTIEEKKLNIEKLKLEEKHCVSNL